MAAFSNPLFPRPISTLTSLNQEEPAAARKPMLPRPPASPAPGRQFNDPNQSQLGTMSFNNLQPRSEPRKFNDPNQTPLGGTTFTNLQPRSGDRFSGLNSKVPGEGQEMSHAGFGNYVDEKTAGSPRRISGFRGKRSGLRFTEGPSKGKTFDQAKIGLREQYAKLSPEEKARYESKARMEDISTPVPKQAVAAAPSELKQPDPLKLARDQPMSLDLGDDEEDDPFSAVRL